MYIHFFFLGHVFQDIAESYYRTETRACQEYIGISPLNFEGDCLLLHKNETAYKSFALKKWPPHCEVLSLLDKYKKNRFWHSSWLKSINEKAPAELVRLLSYMYGLQLQPCGKWNELTILIWSLSTPSALILTSTFFNIAPYLCSVFSFFSFFISNHPHWYLHHFIYLKRGFQWRSGRWQGYVVQGLSRKKS